MANIIKLGSRPKTFKEINIPVTLPDGDEGILPITFKYMTKAEFGKWQDSLKTSPEELGGAADEFSWERFYQANAEKSADALLAIIASWGIDAPLSKQSIQQLEADCGASVIPAVLAAFGTACREGRLGN